MKILFEASLFGMAHSIPRARTGVFRVVERFASGLLKQPDCELGFCGATTVDAWNQLQDFLATDSPYRNVPLAPPASPLLSLRRASYLAERMLRLELEHRVAHQKIGRKALRFASRNATRLQDWLRPRPAPRMVSASWLSRYDIFQGTFFPIPEYIRQAPGLTVFQTIYDLIPVLKPEFFEGDRGHSMNQVVADLDRESWVVSISEFTKMDLCNYRKEVDPERVFVIPLAASEIFHPVTDPAALGRVLERYSIPVDAPYLLSLSTLEPRKNIDRVIRCFARLIRQERVPDLKLVLIGTKGWDYARIFREIESAPELKSRIILPGFVPDEDLAALYSRAFAFIYVSLYEGFGLPPLEAMQCGTPVIVSSTTSLPEVVGDAALLVEPTDEEAISGAMLKLWNSPTLREEFRDKGLKRAKLFSWEKSVALLRSAYQTALAGR